MVGQQSNFQLSMTFLRHEDHTLLFSKCSMIKIPTGSESVVMLDPTNTIKLLSKFEANGNQSETLDLGCTFQDCISAVYILCFFWHRFFLSQCKRQFLNQLESRFQTYTPTTRISSWIFCFCILWKLLDLLIQNTYSNKVETMHIFQTKEYFLISRLIAPYSPSWEKAFMIIMYISEFLRIFKGISYTSIFLEGGLSFITLLWKCAYTL